MTERQETVLKRYRSGEKLTKIAEDMKISYSRVLQLKNKAIKYSLQPKSLNS